MSGFDYLVFLVVGLAAIMGFFRGFVEEVLALAAWCLAMMAVHYGHELLADLLTPYVHNDTGAAVLAFAILLAVPYFAMKLLARSVGSASRSSMLGPIDRVLGFGFGALKGFVVMVLAFSLLVLCYDVVWGAKGTPAVDPRGTDVSVPQCRQRRTVVDGRRAAQRCRRKWRRCRRKWRRCRRFGRFHRNRAPRTRRAGTTVIRRLTPNDRAHDAVHARCAGGGDRPGRLAVARCGAAC